MQRGDLRSTAYVLAAAAWAEALLARLAGDAASAVEPEETEGMADLAARFRLGAMDRRVLGLLLGVERSLAAARRVRDLTGRGRVTVELLRLTLGDEAEAALTARGPLRAHCLVTVDGLPGGIAAPSSGVALAAGMAARLAGTPPSPDELGHGVEMVHARAKPVLAESLAEAAREHLVDVEPGWVTITGARPGDAALLAAALSFRIERPVALLDARVTTALAPAAAWELLAAVRRECDLVDAPLIVDGAAAAGGAWRALTAPPPHGRRAKAVVLVNPEAPAPRQPQGFVGKTVQFVSGASTPAAEAPSTNPIAAARRQAAADAARELGRPVPGKDVPIRAAVARPEAAAVPASADAVVELAASEEPRAAPAPAPAPAPGVEAPPPAAAAAAAAKPTPSPSPIVYPKPSAPPPTKRPEHHAPRPTASPSPSPGPIAKPIPNPIPIPIPIPSPIPIPIPSPAAAEVSAQAPAPPPAPGADPAESLPYLEPPTEATLADIIKLAYAAPNPNQKAEIMAELATLKKDPAILKLFRFFAGHAHPRVRAAAEDGLTRMFGDAWKRTAGIKPPVQPPREGE